MRYCSKCGEAMEDDAVFCENCGKRRGSSEGRGFMAQGEIVQSTRLFTKQQVLFATISMIGGGIMIMMMSGFIPNDPFFNDSRGTFILLGLGSIVMGVAIYILGNRNIDEES
ncbi:MAG TPA: zinc-ribbon domain-containing protein [Methanomassiliicoccales archaeon]|nr:zinc-ribbon domain-containing protein [Methanomassiliicoccales archaeon]